jgi:acyl-CoA thioester hydrolase
VHRTPIQMRFSDTDALGHINNGSFAIYAETARLELMGALGGSFRSLILAHLSIDFRRQVMFGEPVEVTTEVVKLGTTSVTMRQVVLAAGEPAAEVRSVVVLFDYTTQRPRPLPTDARSQLAPYMASPAGE